MINTCVTRKGDIRVLPAFVTRATLLCQGRKHFFTSVWQSNRKAALLWFLNFLPFCCCFYFLWQSQQVAVVWSFKNGNCLDGKRVAEKLCCENYSSHGLPIFFSPWIRCYLLQQYFFLSGIILFLLSFSWYCSRETPQSLGIMVENIFASKHHPRGPTAIKRANVSRRMKHNFNL